MRILGSRKNVEKLSDVRNGTISNFLQGLKDFQFIASALEREKIEKGLPNIACVEMEGTAVVQVCCEFGIPFTIIRTISDAADEYSARKLLKFITINVQIH